MLALLLACRPDPPAVGSEEPSPLGMALAEDGFVYAGASIVDVTPAIRDTFTDVDGNHDYDAGEPFEDANANGVFDPVWIAGFGPTRPANDVHDPISIRAVVLAQDGEYLALVSSDFVGLHHRRIHPARDALAADGFDPDRLVVTSSHNHQGPDTLGLWGNPLLGIPGFYEEYQEFVTASIEAAVRDAAANMSRVDLKIGAVRMRDRSEWFNGDRFGGKSPDAIQLGMVHDGRDPVVVSDQLLTVQGAGDDGVVFTLTNWSGHPETRGSSSNSISADWPGVTRDVLEGEFGGVAIHLPESLGGMQSALGGDLPLVAEDGTHVFETDEGGDEVPVWADHDSWDFVRSHGWHIAEAAIDTLAEADTYDLLPLRIEWETLYMPVEAELYQLLAPSGVFDLPLDQATRDPELCPEAPDWPLGCMDARTARLELGPVGFVTAPGELLPELAWGFPDDDDWSAEVGDLSSRGTTYFPQHDHDCDALAAYSECVETTAVGDCDCTRLHAWPYRLSDDAENEPMLQVFEDKPFRAVIGTGDTYLSYIVPTPDVNLAVAFPGEDDGDHYEDTVSPSSLFGDRLLEAHRRLAERW